MKKFLVLCFTFCISLSALADNQLIDGLIGLAAGGAGGHALCAHCSSRGRLGATVAGGLGGAWLGSYMGDTSGQTNAQNQAYQQQQLALLQQQNQILTQQQQQLNTQYQQPQPVYVNPQAQYVVPSPTYYVPRPPIVRPVAYVDSQPAVVVPVHRQLVPGCSEEYYNGQFNPPAAIAFCQGIHDRIVAQQRAEAAAKAAAEQKMVADAYQAGYSGAVPAEAGQIAPAPAPVTQPEVTPNAQ